MPGQGVIVTYTIWQHFRTAAKDKNKNKDSHSSSRKIELKSYLAPSLPALLVTQGMSLTTLLEMLGDEIQDPAEETFLLFSQPLPSQNLGFVDPKAKTLELAISGRDLTITQSPGLLSSDREGGTTGAVVWKITPLFADWVSSAQNILFKTSALDRNSQVLELGCGISGIVAILLAPRIGRYIATDQEYVFKLLRANITENTPMQKLTRKKKLCVSMSTESNIKTILLDWESSSVVNLSTVLRDGSNKGTRPIVNAVTACDCIYNEALVDPFVRTCAEICQVSYAINAERPSVCIIAQQLRSDIVFEAWLSAFHKVFRVWRVPDELLAGELRCGSGFVIHIGIMRRGDI